MTPEGAVKQAVIQLLDLERVPHHRLNSGAIRIDAKGNQKRAIIRLQAAGTPDLLMLPMCRNRRVPVYIELKAPRGTQSEKQIEFERWARECGIEYLLVRDVQQVIQWLKENAG